jgi:hypothetical protein
METRSPRISFVSVRIGEPDTRRRWEDLVPREEIACLLAEGRYLDLLMRLGDARVRWPHDLELLRSVRVLEHHLKLRATQTG